MAQALMYGWDTGTGEWVKIEVTDEGKLEISPITFPDDYPLPAAQVADLRDVDVGNFPATYPLSDAQIALLQAVTVGNWPADPSTGGRQDVQTDLISLIYTLLDAGVTIGNWPADPSTGGRQDVQTDLISLIRTKLYSGLGFGGNVYSKTMTMTDDTATRFETTEKKLRDIVIIVQTYGMLLGETGVEVYPVGAGETIGWTKVDISTLYFKNASAGENGVITILGVEE